MEVSEAKRLRELEQENGRLKRLLAEAELDKTALIDRLLHHCHIVNIRGNSYRLREHRKLLQRRPEDQRAEAET